MCSVLPSAPRVLSQAACLGFFGSESEVEDTAAWLYEGDEQSSKHHQG
eukprot:CAMPEP_0203878156 /NCGR_PEP_ID=MMETSP0359-20131031/22712_1 /ASSEMBLY_ACC=CAM_ASM_000338 /TAXON_ID=268821 /ORGANISM="Scrippsiella Hangoei, Strain SHTV-5" /LENGTH=47 /DNA_ID= /DNA_START= /DNA_END= /DNA_ORIENTATION=